jgi:hypothetical protein
MNKSELQKYEKAAVKAYVDGLIGIYEQLGVEGFAREMAMTALMLKQLQVKSDNKSLVRMAVARHLHVAAAAEKARSTQYPSSKKATGKPRQDSAG